MTGTPTAYLFDGAGTLFDCRPPLAEYIARTSHQYGCRIEPQAARRALRSIGRTRGWPDDTDDAAERKAGWLAFFDSVLRTCGADGSNTGHAEAIATFLLDLESYALYDDALPILQTLRANGLKVGLVSNFDSWLRDLLSALRLTRYFNTITISVEVGAAKPDPRVFRDALRRLDVPPGRAVFVGDSLINDVAGAEAVGMTAILLDRDGAHPNYAGRRVASLDEIRAALPAHRDPPRGSQRC